MRELNIKLTEWQKRAVIAEKLNKRLVVNNCRQSGKSTLLVYIICERIKKGQLIFVIATHNFIVFQHLTQKIKEQLAYIGYNLDTIKEIDFIYWTKALEKKEAKVFGDEVIPDLLNSDCYFVVRTKPYVELNFNIDDEPSIKFSELLKQREIMEPNRFNEEYLCEPNE